MLSKSDLQQIRKVFREEIDEENESTRSELRTELKLFRMRLEDKLKRVEDSLRNLSIRLRKVEKDISVAIDIFDRTDVKLQKRVGKIEEHLSMPRGN